MAMGLNATNGSVGKLARQKNGMALYGSGAYCGQMMSRYFQQITPTLRGDRDDILSSEHRLRRTYL
jgi:hypothetical protein